MMEREELTDALRTEAEWAADHDYDIPLMLCGNLRDAVTLLESDAAEIAALKAENERIRQNYISPKVYRMMCDERDSAVAELKKSCNYQFGGCYLCLNQHTDLCKSCLRDDIWADIAKNPKDNWIWRGPQKGKE